jgi:hypothetical protein
LKSSESANLFKERESRRHSSRRVSRYRRRLSFFSSSDSRKKGKKHLKCYICDSDKHVMGNCPEFSRIRRFISNDKFRLSSRSMFTYRKDDRRATPLFRPRSTEKGKSVRFTKLTKKSAFIADSDSEGEDYGINSEPE